MPECAYRLCDIEFGEFVWGGNPKRFCCPPHQRAEGRLRRIEQRSAEDELNRINQTLRDEANAIASLNCTKHQDCLDAASRKKHGEMKCLNCTDSDMVEGAYKDELEEITNDTDTYPLHLP